MHPYISHAEHYYAYQLLYGPWSPVSRTLEPDH
eukprot:COSAG05_NODE_954_length_6442_cov_451.572915_6_plen_33_part_00